MIEETQTLQTLYWLTEEQVSAYIKSTNEKVKELISKNKFSVGSHGLIYRPSVDRFLLMEKEVSR